MKTRDGFVSNSSSSSFIVKDFGFFEHFGLTPADVDGAIADLYGGKRLLAQMAKDRIAVYGRGVAECENRGDRDTAEWYKGEIARIASEGVRPWRVVDMSTKAKKKEAYRAWDAHFAGWEAPGQGADKAWDEFVGALETAGVEYRDVSALKKFGRHDAGADMHIYSMGRRGLKKLPKGSTAFCLEIKKALGVRSMKDVLHDPETTMMIHFDDNEVLMLKGMDALGKADAEEPWVSAKDKAKALKSKYDSPQQSADRFFELLISRLSKTGRIDLSDPEFLKRWEVPPDHWWKRDDRLKDRKYTTREEGVVGWRDVVDGALDYSAVMHEG